MSPMKRFAAEIRIDAEPDDVWRVITDASRYTAWDSGVTRVDGEIRDGEKIVVRAAVGGDRAFPVTVEQAPTHRSMTWTGGLPFGLFRGVRTFTLTGREGGTHLDVHEEFTGPLLGLIGRSIPDLGPSFQQYVNGVKTEAERQK